MVGRRVLVPKIGVRVPARQPNTMPLQVGIVGLPNIGKSTLFNTLLGRQIAAARNYPFTTIEPNIGVVPVPDENLLELAGLVGENVEIVPATVEFVDIAGLVQGAHQGEGLGNQFLARIREVDAIIHLLRGFKDPQVAHVHGSIDPKFDKEIINLELEQAGLSDKPQLVVLNTNIKGEDGTEGPDHILSVDAKSGVGVDQLIQETYRLLNLITLYTIREDRQQVQAWPIKRGALAPAAAGKIHSDFEKHFVKAEVVPLDKLRKAGSWARARQQGLARIEGRGYCINDQDVVLFRVNV